MMTLRPDLVRRWVEVVLVNIGGPFLEALSLLLEIGSVHSAAYVTIALPAPATIVP